MQMTTYVFPGQGSQVRGMGKELFPQFPELVAEANQILGYDIVNLCVEDPDQKLQQTNYTQPALFIVSALTYLSKQKEGSLAPHYTAGHSLGEYNALFAAGVFDFSTGLKLVQKRGELMSQAEGGGMAAIVGFSADQVKSLLEQNKLNAIAIANYNTHTQIVISGLKTDIDQAIPLFEKAGAPLVVPLKVSGAFHSPYMNKAEQEFSTFIQPFSFASPHIPVIANINAQPYSADNIKSNLTKQITHPVRWTDSINYLLKQGETTFEEIGPGRVLRGLIQKIQQGK
jgi:malonyl CoA-acyl carrier protein transacylase